MQRTITTERDKQAATIRRLNEIVADLDRCANRLQVESLRGATPDHECPLYAAFECADEAAMKARERLDELNESLDAADTREQYESDFLDYCLANGSR